MCLFVFSPLPLVSCSRVSSAFPVQKEMADNLLVLAQLTAVQSYLKFKNFDFFFFSKIFFRLEIFCLLLSIKYIFLEIFLVSFYFMLVF